MGSGTSRLYRNMLEKLEKMRLYGRKIAVFLFQISTSSAPIREPMWKFWQYSDPCYSGDYCSALSTSLHSIITASWLHNPCGSPKQGQYNLEV